MNILILIIKYLTVFVTQFILIRSYIYLLPKKIKMTKQMVGIIVLSSLIELILSDHISGMFNGILCITYFIILSKYYTKLKLKDTIFYMISIYLIGISIDIFLMLIVNLIHIKYSWISTNLDSIKLISTILMNFIILIITKLKTVHKIIDKIHVYASKINLFYVFFFGTLILFFILEVLMFVNDGNQVIVELIFSFAVLLILVIVKFILNQYEIITLKETNQLLIENNEFCVKVINEYRVLKHNLTSKLLGIKSISNKESKKLIDSLIKEYNKSYQVTQDIKSVPVGINGIIYQKIYNFNKKSLNIVVDNKIKSKILNVITPRSYNLLCEALGVTLDNALESSYHSKDKVIYLKFNETKECLIITIINTFSGDIDLDQLGIINYSTKNNGHGLGLYSLLGRKNIQVKNIIKNNLFISKITINKKN